MKILNIQWTRKKKIIAALALISLACVFYISSVTQPISPPNTPTPTPVPQTAVSSLSDQYNTLRISHVDLLPTVLKPQIPPKFGIYAGQVNLNDLKPVAAKLAQNLNLQKNTTLPFDYWNNSDGTQQISIDPYLLTITYINQTPSLSPVKPDAQQGSKVAEDFFSQNLNLPNLKPQPDTAKYIKIDGEHYVYTTQANSDSIEFNFNQYIDQIPLVYDAYTIPPVAIIVGENHTVRKVVISSPGITMGTKIKDQESLTLAEALEKINKGEGKVISADGITGLELEVRQLPNAKIGAVTVEYRFDPATRIVSPYYRFSGTFNDTKQIGHTIEITTSATK